MESYAPYAAMVVVQLSSGATIILLQVALAKGQNQFVFMVYIHILSTITLTPFAYLLERKQRPPLSFPLVMKIFAFTTIGITTHHNLDYLGLANTSATVESALSNVVPSLTFLMAFLLGYFITLFVQCLSNFHPFVFTRMETVNIKSKSGFAKVFGTIICISGSLIFTLWKGGHLYGTSRDRPLINYLDHGLKPLKENWIKGSSFILVANIAWSLWLILLAMVYKDYSAPLSLNTLICFFATIQSSVVALVLARDPALWKLGWNEKLLSILYGGVFMSIFGHYLRTWCISKNGPVFAAMFNPLRVLIVGIFSAIAFAERLHVGSLVGLILIIFGLYCYLWGKRQDSSATEESQKAKALHDDKIMKDISINVNDTRPILPQVKRNEEVIIY